MTEIVGACLSQFHDDENNFELLLAFADGREVGHSVSRAAAQRISAEFANEFQTPSPAPNAVTVGQGVEVKAILEAAATAVDKEWRASGAMNCTRVCAIIRSALHPTATGSDAQAEGE